MGLPTGRHITEAGSWRPLFSRLGKVGLFALAGIVSVAIVLAGPRVAWAASQGKIVVSSEDGTTHEYMAYRILEGTVSSTGIREPKLAATMPTDVLRQVGATDADLASDGAIADWLIEAAGNDSTGAFSVSLAKAIADNGSVEVQYTFATGETVSMDEGYYLVTSGDGQPMLVPVPGNATKAVQVTEKATVPVPTKTVSAQGSEGSSSTACAGQEMSYEIAATLPKNLKAFGSYKLWFHDKPSSALSYEQDSIRTKLVHEDGTSEDIALTTSVEAGELTVGTDDLVAAVPGVEPTDTIVVDYDCTVGEGVTCGLEAGNPNELILTYSLSPQSELTTSSVTKVATVYSFQIDVNKVAKSSGAALTGAGFVLQNADGEYLTTSGTWSESATEAKEVATDGQGSASFSGLAAGAYTLTEKTAPSGYKLLGEPVVVTLAVTDADTDTPTLTATATGADATVTSVDAASGVATVKVQDAKSDSESEEEEEEEEEDANGNKSGVSRGGVGGSGSSSSGGKNGGAKKPSTPSSLMRTIRSLLPSTSDPLQVAGVGMLVAAAGLVLFGALRRRAANGSRDGE